MDRIFLLTVALLIGCVSVLANDINSCIATSTITCKNIRNTDQQNSPCQCFMREFHSIQKPAGTICNATSKSHVLNGLTEINGGFYYFHTNVNDKKSWHGAFDFCRSRYMELVTIETAKEDKVLTEKVHEMFGTENEVNLWIGLNALDKEGQYRWTSNGREAIFTNWYPTEPNNPETEKCGSIRVISEGTAWNNLNCNFKDLFICEMP